MNEKGIRINKYLSQCGVASRREAEQLILSKKVKVNGEFAILGQKILETDIVLLNNKEVIFNENKIYYLLNKPKKTICTLKDNFGRKKVTDLIDDNNYLFPVGRLDYNTTGVLLITNDGELANKLIHPSSEIKRTYRARLNKPLTHKELFFLNSPNIEINGSSSFQVVEQVDTKSYLVTLHQGSYHHVKKLFQIVDRDVLDLKRIEFAGLTCDGMVIGSYRKLKPFEIKSLKKMVNL